MHLSAPREGLPPLLDSASLIASGAERLANGHGPIAVDTERASAFRFDERAFLIQLRREGVGTLLIDPAGAGSSSGSSSSSAGPDAADVQAALDELGRVMNSAPWILHAAHTDLPALTTLGWRPTQLHDTQIAGRLLGMGQPGLLRMLEEFLDTTIDKDKGREDWSARPLTPALLSYAALDVELLLELLDEVVPLLRQAGRYEWYLQDCAAVLEQAQPLRVPEWRAVKGAQSVRNPRSLAVVRALAEVRLGWAQAHDRPLERTIHSKDILALASHPRSAEHQLRRVRMPAPLVDVARTAVRQAVSLEQDQLPQPIAPNRRSMPDHRVWEEEYPRAHRALSALDSAVKDLAEELELSSDALAVMRHLRPAAWELSRVKPDKDDPIGSFETALGETLASHGSREWQRELINNHCLSAVIAAMS